MEAPGTGGHAEATAKQAQPTGQGQPATEQARPAAQARAATRQAQPTAAQAQATAKQARPTGQGQPATRRAQPTAGQGQPATEQAEARWLDEDERRCWFAVMSLLLRLPSALDAQLQRDSGLSNFEYQVMAGLSDQPDRTMRISELAALAGGSLPRMSQVIARLEKRGWVRRTPDPADGRYTLAILTGDGQQKVAQTAPGHLENVRRLIFDPLTKAQPRQLTDIARRILRAADPADSCLDHREGG
jgi:DNA-binding MarR family transcriptional regulator